MTRRIYPAGEATAFFRANLSLRGPECKIWPYGQTLPARPDRNYGRVYLDGKMHRVHVLACIDRWGPSPNPAFIVAHGPCHNTLCWNGDHVSWKARKGNTADMKRDGTAPIGSKHGRSKLTEAEVLAIRGALASGAPPRALAVQFDVTRETIGLIRRGRIWKHVGLDQPI